ncbi:MAG TPA: adenine phosphoribosyltransferase [Actinophytocola sp.]|jgi:adenine phosphoribosyltransferase|uniref:adenine phosphoribosyltransferase n=1 Tax=Actinophytocola sp. TaxID=1872138 RepID=UPI002F93CD91
MDSVAGALELVRTVPDFPEPGVLFRDLTPVFASPSAFTTIVDALAAGIPSDVDVIAPVEARGFLLGGALSTAMDRGLIPIRKPGKLPVVAGRVEYTLEYGTAVLELPAEAITPGTRVAVVDDVLATGGTVAATCELLENAGAVVVSISVVLELEALGGRKRLGGREVHALQAI